MKFPLCIAPATALALALNAPLAAQTIVIDNGIFDGILDGFPMLAPMNGQPDFGGNPLAVALQSGVTEERGIGEFPLAALADTPSSSIASARLVFNIDDVLSTFGPGTAFRGEAARTIFVHTYDGNGVIDLDDFLAIDRAPIRIDTTSRGTITDASLRQSGPLVFEVDITTDVRESVAAGAPALGVVWRTDDSPTGTSIDDLGDGGSGPPGTGGARMPFITIEVSAVPATPTTVPATPTSVPATSAPTATPSATASLRPPTATPFIGPCVGDCNDDGQISVAEIVTGVNIALQRLPLDRCVAFDLDGNGTVSISELILAVNASLFGCT